MSVIIFDYEDGLKDYYAQSLNDMYEQAMSDLNKAHLSFPTSLIDIPMSREDLICVSEHPGYDIPIGTTHIGGVPIGLYVE